MSVFSYVAKRFLISGHTLDSAYDLEIPVAEYQADILNDGNQSYTDSKIQTNFHGFVISHKFKTIPRSHAQDDEILEFLMSAIDGQTISFDVVGTIAVPNNVITGTLKYQKTMKPSIPGHQLRARTFEILEIT